MADSEVGPMMRQASIFILEKEGNKSKDIKFPVDTHSEISGGATLPYLLWFFTDKFTAESNLHVRAQISCGEPPKLDYIFNAKKISHFLWRFQISCGGDLDFVKRGKTIFCLKMKACDETSAAQHNRVSSVGRERLFWWREGWDWTSLKAEHSVMVTPSWVCTYDGMWTFRGWRFHFGMCYCFELFLLRETSLWC